MILQFETRNTASSPKGSIAAVASTALITLGKELRQRDYRFVTPTARTIELVNSRPGNDRARSLVDIFGWNRAFHPAQIPTSILAPMQEAGVLEESPTGLRSTVRVSSIGDELYFHSAHPAVAEDSVFFGPDTYRFVRQLRQCVPGLAGGVTRCIDIGCGAGAGALELARMCPGASVHAVDINPTALTLTRVNALLADASTLLPEYSDMLANVQGTFDLIIANPHGAASDGELPLAAARSAIARLAPGGTLLLYTAAAIIDGQDQLQRELARLMDRAGLAWSYDEIDPDVSGEELASRAYGGADRIAAVWLTATKPASHKVYW